MTTQTIQPQVSATKLLPIGRGWINDRDNGRGTSPALTVLLDKNLGLNITLTPGAKLVMFNNEKREGRRDADYRVAISVPTEVAVAEINRQKAARNINSGVSVSAV
jgi:hypothetical protein